MLLYSFQCHFPKTFTVNCVIVTDSDVILKLVILIPHVHYVYRAGRDALQLSSLHFTQTKLTSNYCFAMSSPVSASPDPDYDVERFTSSLAGTSTAPSSPPTQASECDFQGLGVSPSCLSTWQSSEGLLAERVWRHKGRRLGRE
jgi:hypothetical protein